MKNICDFVEGEVLYTTGLDMNCKKCVTRVTFVRVHDDGRIITRSGGILVIGGYVSEYFKSRKDAQSAIE